MLVPDQGSYQLAFMNRDFIELVNTQEALKKLRDNIESGGLSWERDRETLEKTFGKNGNAFVERYRDEAERTQGNSDAAEQSAKNILRDIKYVIEYLNPISIQWSDEKAAERYRTRTAALIPTAEIAEKLLRYQITLERSIERTLTQLERLQHMRLGKPVVPPINVSVSAG